VEYNQFKNIKKQDLHVHLNGAIPTETIIKLINEQEIIIPEGFNLNTNLQIKEPTNSLREYFLPWEVLKLLPRDYGTLCIMVEKAVEKLVSDNINYVEFRNSPFYLSKLNNIPLNEAVSWLVNALHKSSIKFNIDARLILSLTRHELKDGQGIELLKAIKASNKYNIIVGVDMSGDEDVFVPKGINKFFLNAKEEYGLNITIHAGETGNFENIKWAISECNADRIGHGSAAMYSESTLSLIKEKDVCLEVCLYSNLMSGNCADLYSHPIKKFLEWDIPFVLCTDNPSVHDKQLSEEYLLFLECFNRLDVINDMVKRTKKYSFV
jgi:adenosine deaminase